MSGPTNDAAAADQALRAAHGRLLGDDRIQFELPDAAVPVSRPPPDWLRGLLDALGEFLRSIEEDREPSISGRNNLSSLEICFAALASADTGKPVKPGQAKTGRL